jgi:hypothetical protein
MQLDNNTLTVCFAILRIIIIRVCVKIFVMARFIFSFFFKSFGTHAPIINKSYRIIRNPSSMASNFNFSKIYKNA